MTDRLPEPDLQRDDENVVQYGSRILVFLLDTGITATVTDQGLELADHAAIYAVSARDILPSAVDRISDVRHLIATTLRHRQLDQAPATVPSIAPPERPDGNSMVRLQPLPRVQPPAAGRVRPVVDISF